MNLTEMRAAFDASRARLVELSDIEEPTDEQRAEMDTLIASFDADKAALDAAEARAAVVERARATKTTSVPGVGPTVIRKVDSDLAVDVTSLNRAEARDRALKAIDSDDLSGHLSDQQRAKFEHLVRGREPGASADQIARRLIVTENPHYQSAFMKVMSRSHPMLTADEGAALEQWEQFRAASIGTTTAGGFGVPILIDPTIILVSQGTPVPLLQIASVKTITTQAWRGVTSVGSSWSFDGEATEVSDDTPVLAQPIITTHKAQASIPFSIEVGQDYPGFQAEMSMVLAEGYMELLADKLITGTGTIEPFGVVTKLDTITASEVTPTTDGSFGAVDIFKVWDAVPQRFRQNASWLMSTDVENEIRQFGTALSATYTADMTAEGIPRLLGKPVYISDYMGDFSGTTGASNLLVVGDFKAGYCVVQRVGMEVELVPHLLATANNLPSGQRAWYAYARVGGNTVANNALRLLQNQ